MHGKCENKQRYDYKTCKMDTKNIAMHVNPKHK